jgi:hypothetical protein
MEYITDRDLGDENDAPELDIRAIEKAVEEQLQMSFRVLAEADTLPDHLVDYHRRILICWGMLGKTLPIHSKKDQDDS